MAQRPAGDLSGPGLISFSYCMINAVRVSTNRSIVGALFRLVSSRFLLQCGHLADEPNGFADGFAADM